MHCIIATSQDWNSRTRAKSDGSEVGLLEMDDFDPKVVTDDLGSLERRCCGPCFAAPFQIG